jgi:outer membrane receptor protein involved in Fe transport
LGNIQARYSFAEKTSLSIEAQYVSSYFMDEANSVEYKGHTLFNARFSHSDGPLEYWLAARNIANEKYAEFATVSFGRNSYNPGAPRTILAGIRYNFGGK